MAIHIADAYVDIEAKDQTHEDVDRIMQRLRDLGPVEIELRVKDETREESERILRRLESLGPVDIALRVDDQTASGIAAVEARLRSIRSIDIGLRLDNQTSASLAELRARLDSLGPYAVRLGLDVDDAALDILRARLQALGPFQVEIELELDPWAIDNIRRRLAALGGVSVPIDAHFDGHAGLAAAWTELERFRLLASRLLNIPVTAHDNLDVGLGQAYAEMLMFRQLAEHTLRIPVTTSGGVNFPGLGGAAGAAGQAGEQAAGQAQMITAAVVAAFPAIAVAVGGAATVAVGAALAAIPVIAWKGSKEVKDAYTSLWADLKGGIRDITPEWKGMLVAMTGTLRNVGSEWKPFFADIFADLGPGVNSFVTNLVTGLDILKPSIRQIVDGFDAMAPTLGAQLPKVLEGITSGFAHLAQGVKDNPEIFGQLLIDLSQVVDMIGELGQASMGLTPILDVTYGNVENINKALGSLVGYAEGAGGALDSVGIDSGRFGEELGKLGKTILSVAGGPLTMAIDGWNQYKGAQADAGVGAVTFDDILGVVNASVYAAATADAELSSKNSELVDSMQIASMTADELKAAFDRLTKAALDEWDAHTAVEKAIDKMTSSLKQNGHTIDANTKAGRANRDGLSSLAKKFHDYIEAMNAHHEPAKKIEAEAERLRKKFYDFAFSLTGSSAKARKLTDDLLGLKDAVAKVPAAKTTKLRGDLTDLQLKLSKAITSLALVPPWKRSKLLLDIAQLQAKIRAAQGELASIHDKNVHVRVMTDHVGGLGTLTPKEKGQANGSVRTYADGGENHVAQIARPGEYRLWAEDETGGEAYIPLAAAKRRRSLAILEDVARRFGMGLTRPMEDGALMAFAGGGVTPGLMDGGKGGLTELGVGMTEAQMKAAEKAAADMRKLLAEISAAGKKLLSGITKAMLGSLDKVNAYAENLNAMIKKYLWGAQEKATLKWASAIEAKMRSAATQAEAIAATIKEAKDFAASTKQTLVGGSGIASLGAIGNAQDVKGGLQFRAGEMERFADQLGQLAKLGLNKDSILEIVGYGPQQGGALAAMLLKDTGTFAAINSAESAIEAAAGNIGNLAADQMYDTGKHAADGFLTGLYAKQKDLEALMGTLGEQLAAGIKKVVAEAKATAKATLTEEKKTSTKPSITGLGVGSTKKRATGGIVEAGDWALVGEQGPELVHFGSRGNVHTAGETAGMLGGGITVTNLNVNVTGTFDFADAATRQQVAKQLATEVQEELRVLERSKR